MKSLVVLTGAGISAESGIKTFRDAGGLWETHKIEEVASPQAWEADPEMVLRFYNMRRKQLQDVKPNKGHETLADLENDFEVTIITQNVDDLHERAGSSKVLHLHGELLKVRSEAHPDLVYEWPGELNMGDTCDKGAQLRPHIVWFGEPVPLFEEAIALAEKAEIFLVVGTSLQVYPAASLIRYAPLGIPIYYIDPQPSFIHDLSQFHQLEVISEPAGDGLPKVAELLRNQED